MNMLDVDITYLACRRQKYTIIKTKNSSEKNKIFDCLEFRMYTTKNYFPRFIGTSTVKSNPLV